MAKKYRGFGDKLKIFSFDWKPPNQNFDNEKKIITKYLLWLSAKLKGYSFNSPTIS